MKLIVDRVVDVGNLDKERVIMRAEEEDNLTNYAVFSCRVSDKEKFRAGAIPDVFWFWNRAVKAGDLVVLYTKTGVVGEKANTAGTKSYFYYWHKDKPIWATDRRCVLVHTLGWKTTDPEKEEDTTI